MNSPTPQQNEEYKKAYVNYFTIVAVCFVLAVGVAMLIWALIRGNSFTQPAVGYYPGDLSKGIRYIAIRGVAMFYDPTKKQISSEQYNWKEVAYLDGTYENHFKFGKNNCWTDKMTRKLKQDEVVKVSCDCPGRVNPKQQATMMVYDQTH